MGASCFRSCLEGVGLSSTKAFVDLGTPMPPTPSKAASSARQGKRGVGYGSLSGLERERSGRMGGSAVIGEETALLSGRVASKREIVAPSRGANKRWNAAASSSSSKTLTDKYALKEVLGVGSTSTCHRCVRISDGVSFACKIIDKRHIEERFRGLLEQFNVEIEVLKELSHPGIIKLEDVYTTSDKIYIVMEMMSGGELFDYVVEKGTLTEEEASEVVRKVTGAVVYMHSKNIMHRDLKPENLLLTHKPKNNGDKPECKIIDFGLSKLMVQSGGGLATSFLGTKGYLAPEMLQRRDYDKSVDIWALGVIVFVLLCGCLPFDDDSDVPSDQAVREKFVLRFPKWARNLSDSAKDLLKHLLDTNPATRYTASEALNHPWVRGTTVKPANYLQSPRIIRTPGTGSVRNGGKKTKDRLAELNAARRNNGDAGNNFSPRKRGEDANMFGRSF